ncbi:MAG: gliding motility-associated C-terminal domain-containing protein [Ferruginibacter sp.]
MQRGILLIAAVVIFCMQLAYAQPCTSLGQNPSTAFPVCGTAPFFQTTVPICSGRNMIVPGCAGTATYADKNPYWYKFTCFQAGTLGFLITPTNPGDDYDWQLFDITGRNPDDVYTDARLIVTGNWAGTYGATGASASGVNYIQCASIPSDNKPSFAQMPQLILGHQYLLMVSHFTDSQVGYVLSFGGGTAVITDPLQPHMLSAEAACDGKEIRIRINKKMKCNSLAINGSDFSLSTTATSIVSATGGGCTASFDMDSIILFLNNPIPPGNHTITIKKGNDNNTLLDNCDREVPVGEQISFTVYPLVPTPMDSLTKPGCAPQSLSLVFKKLMKCNSVEPGGSDFMVTGPTAVTVSGAACSGNLSKIITVQLAGPIQFGGIYTLFLKRGTDGNTILDECSQETPASSINFTIKDTVNADFSYNIIFSCDKNSVQYSHDGRNGTNIWKWSFDGTRTSNIQNPLITYTNFQPKNTQLIVSNGVCSDTSTISIVFDNLLEADFEVTNLICPQEQASFKELSRGNVLDYLWKFGNGNTSILKDPPPESYPVSTTTRNVAVQLIIHNSYGCYDTATRYIKVVNNCYIAVPSAFTPNGDGLNDYLYPLNAYKAKDLTFSVYNRFGQRLFYTNDWLNKWDGTFKGQGADPGTYVWILTYTHTDTNRRIEQKGTTILIR